MSWMLTARLPDRLHAAIQAEINSSGRTVTELVAELLGRGLSGKVVPAAGEDLRRARVVFMCPRCDRELRVLNAGIGHCGTCGGRFAIP